MNEKNEEINRLKTMKDELLNGMEEILKVFKE